MPFPANILSLADAIGSQFLSVFFGGTVPHSTGINQMKADLIAVEQKLGIGASTPPATAAVLRRTAAGSSAWGQVVPADIAGGGSANTVARTTDGTTVAFAKAQAADIAGGGTGNRVLRTTDGTTPIWGQVVAADVSPGGVANSVLKSTNGTVAGFGSIAPADITPGANGTVLQTAGGSVLWNPSLAITGPITSGAKLFPNNQNNLGFDAPVSAVSVAAGGLIQIGTTGRMGLFICIDGGSGQSAIYQLHGIGNTATLLVGSTALFDVVGGPNSKVNVIYSSGSYFVYNGYPAARTMNGMFLGIGT